MRLGFFPNFTHAPALVGLQEGLFKDALKPLAGDTSPGVFGCGADSVVKLQVSDHPLQDPAEHFTRMRQ